MNLKSSFFAKSHGNVLLQTNETKYLAYLNLTSSVAQSV